MNRHAPFFCGLLIAAAILLPAGDADAQTVRGWVLDESTGQPVQGAHISVRPTAADTVVAQQVSATGSFHLFVGTPGLYRVHVDGLGYAPLVVELELGEGAVVTLELKVRADAIALEPVRVVAERVEPWFMRDVRMRQERGFGRFLTRDEIDTFGGASLEDVLVLVPGVRLVHHEVGMRTIPLVATRAGAMAFGECFASLYVDGVRQFEMRTDQPGGAIDPAMLERAQDVFMLSASEIEAVEVYRGVAELPGEFGGTTSQCGAVAIWLRAGFDPQLVRDVQPHVFASIHAVGQHLAGHLAPAAGMAVEAGVFWNRSDNLTLGVRLLRASHVVPAETMAQLTARLNPDSYAALDGERPMTVTVAGLESRFGLLERGAVRGFAVARLNGARRTLTLDHRVRGRSHFATSGWGAGAGVGAETLLNDRFALQATLVHDRIRFGSFHTLDDPEGPSSAATWSATSLRLGFSWVLAAGR